MSNSSLVTYSNITSHKSLRTAKIDTITIHHAAGIGFTAKQGCDYFVATTKGASSNYYIGNDGSIGLSVPEDYRAWTSSNGLNDDRAVTIEVANSKGDPNWEISDKAMTSLINLVADICKRNNIEKLLWKNDKSLIGQVDKQNMTVHQWFAATGCPGPYLMSKMGEIAEKVNKKLGVKTPGESKPEKKSINDIANEVVIGKWGAGAERKAKLEAAGYDYNEVQAEVKRIMSMSAQCPTTQKTNSEIAEEVVLGKWGAGAERKKKLEAAGYNYNEIQAEVDKIMAKYSGNNSGSSYSARVTASLLNVRALPGTGYKIISSLPYGYDATVLEERTIGGQKWGKIKEKNGWICLAYTKKV